MVPTVLFSQDRTYVAPDVNIISVTPVQGSGLNIDRVPGKMHKQLIEINFTKEKFFYYRNLK